jgi:hypothetical protein
MDLNPEVFSGNWSLTNHLFQVRSLSFATAILPHFQVCFYFETKGQKCAPLSHAYVYKPLKPILSRGVCAFVYGSDWLPALACISMYPGLSSAVFFCVWLSA